MPSDHLQCYISPRNERPTQLTLNTLQATFIGFKRDRRIVKETHQENNLKTGQPLEQGGLHSSDRFQRVIRYPQVAVGFVYRGSALLDCSA